MNHKFYKIIIYIIFSSFHFLTVYYLGAFFLKTGLDINYEYAKDIMWKGIFTGFAISGIISLLKPSYKDFIKNYNFKE